MNKLLLIMLVLLVVPFVSATDLNISQAYNFQNLTYSSVFLSTTYGTQFNNDGSVLYTITKNDDRINALDLSTPYEITTASYGTFYSFVSQFTAPQAFYISPDGLKLYALSSNFDNIYQYNLSTAWDITTASFHYMYNDTGKINQPIGIYFSNDGVYMYVLESSTGPNNRIIYQYELSTAYDISTSTYVDQLVLSDTIRPGDLYFSSDGTKFYTGDKSGAGYPVDEYSTNNAYNISTYVKTNSLQTNVNFPNGLTFHNNNNNTFYVNTNSILLGYSLQYLNITFKNESSNNIITSNIDLILSNSNFYNTSSISTGNIVYPNIDSEEYDLAIRSTNFNNITANLVVNVSANNNIIYLNQDGVAKTFTVRSTDTQILADAQLKVEKFINGSWTQLYTVATDVTGQAILYLIEGDVYRITASKDGYDPLTIVQEFPEDVYPITLDFARDLDFNGFTAGVSWAYQPIDNYLNPSDNQTFNFTVSAQGNDLASFAILAYNGSTFIDSVSESNPAGGTLSLEINTTAYLNENINIRYRFTKENFTSYTIPVPYYIQDVNITGTFVEMRNFIVDNISIRDRIIIYTIIMFVFILCLALLGNMYMVAFVASALSPFVGYLTGINVIFLTILSLVIMLSLFINPRGGGL